MNAYDSMIFTLAAKEHAQGREGDKSGHQTRLELCEGPVGKRYQQFLLTDNQDIETQFPGTASISVFFAIEHALRQYSEN